MGALRVGSSGRGRREVGWLWVRDRPHQLGDGARLGEAVLRRRQLREVADGGGDVAERQRVHAHQRIGRLLVAAVAATARGAPVATGRRRRRRFGCCCRRRGHRSLRRGLRGRASPAGGGARDSFEKARDTSRCAADVPLAQMARSAGTPLALSSSCTAAPTRDSILRATCSRAIPSGSRASSRQDRRRLRERAVPRRQLAAATVRRRRA